MLQQAFKRLRSALSSYWSRSSSPLEIQHKPVSTFFEPSSSSSLSRLPLELVAIILDELAVLDLLDGGTASAPMTAPSREIRMALASCAQVRRSWYWLAQEHLYRSIVVVNLRDCEAFVHAIENNPALALIPRHLVLFGGPVRPSMSSVVEQKLERRHDLLVRVLRLCTGLERVRLTHNWDIFYKLVVVTLSRLEHLSSLYCRPHILEVGENHFSILQAHDVLSRLPPSLQYLFIDSTVGKYDFLHHVPPTIGIVEYQLSSRHEACDPTFVLEELEADLVEGIKATPGGRIRVLHKQDVDSALVGRVLAGFAAQGVELVAVKTT
ncbi:hypothetical protein JCM9279_003814 [Rhodotorula babjevae]